MSKKNTSKSLAASCPRVVSWIIDSKCNLNCPHCYVSAGTKSDANLSRTDIDRACESIASIKPEMIILSGGEPTMNQNILHYIKKCRAITKGQLFVCTNGTLISDKVLKKSKNLGVDGFFVSLDHVSEKINDSIRGEGSTKKILKCMKTMKNNGIKYALDVTVIKQNVNDIKSFFTFAVKNGIDKICFTRFKPIGRGAKNKSKLMVGKKRYIKALEAILELAIKYDGKISVHAHEPLYGVLLNERISFSDKERSKIVKKQLDGFYLSPFCKAGLYWVGIGPNGDVSPCPVLLYTGVRIGNILKDNLFDIVNKSVLVKKLIRRRKDNNCPYLKSCGCCLAYNHSRGEDMFSKDNMCWISR